MMIGASDTIRPMSDVIDLHPRMCWNCAVDFYTADPDDDRCCSSECDTKLREWVTSELEVVKESAPS